MQSSKINLPIGKRKTLTLLLTAMISFSTNIQYAFAIPRRGVEPWSLILCKFNDLADYEPKSRQWFQRWLLMSAQNEDDSIEQFFWQVSNGVYSIDGSNVHGWFILPFTQKEVLRIVNDAKGKQQKEDTEDGKMPPLGSDTSFDYFDKVKELCIAEAQNNGTSLHRQKITVVNAGTAAVYGKNNGVLLTPQLMFSSVLTHEMVHSFFIGHSYSDREIRVFPYAAKGEYDDRYDLMSTANAYMHRSQFGMSGPGLNGAHLDFLGWLPMDRLLYFGRDGRQNYTLRLSSLSVPHNKTFGWLLVLLPYDRDDPNNYFTVELRTPHQFDQGIAQSSILIHRVNRIGESYYSQLVSQADLYELAEENTEWVTFLEPLASAEKVSTKNKSDTMKNFQFIRVTVRKIFETDADLHISSTFNPSECHMGERVLRAARWSQPYIIGLRNVCLGPTDQQQNVTVLKPARAERGVQSGSTTVRLLDEQQLRKQFARKNFFSIRRTWGANACRQGLVWRSLDPYDFVCVSEIRREAAQSEDLHHMERLVTVPFAADEGGENALESHLGSHCAEPYLPRRAFPGDDICVSAAEKFRVFRENLQVYSTLQNVAFFNGLDSVGP